MNESFFKRVYALVKQVPKGKVVTYGQVAAMLGNPRMSRQVGYALHVNPEPGDVIPCHRVIDRFGSLTRGFAFGGIEVQVFIFTFPFAGISVPIAILCPFPTKPSTRKRIWRVCIRN